jgi:uncharacterized protein YjbI with pentapeptide repeats
MALRAGQSYTTDNGTTTVIQGALTPEQTAWWNRSGTPNYLTLTPAQKLYIALCQKGMHLQQALKSCDLKEKKAAEAKKVLRTLDKQGEPRVNADGVVKQVTRLSLPEQRLYLEICLIGRPLPESFGLTDELEAQQALNILNADRTPRVNDYGVVTHITRPSFVGANLQEYDLRGADLRGAEMWRAEMQRAQLQGADLRYADLRGADLYKAQMQGADLRDADLRWAFLRRAKLQGSDLRDADLQEALLHYADLRGADLQDAEMQRAKLDGSDISGANFKDAKNLNTASLNLAFYCQDNPPKNLAGALNGVQEKKRPMALTRQEYDKVCRLRNSNNLSAFEQELDRLRDVCNKRIDSQPQVDTAVDAAKAKFEWCKPLVSTKVAIMFSQGFNPQTRAAWYGNSVGGKVLRGISHGLEFLNNHLGDRRGR